MNKITQQKLDKAQRHHEEVSKSKNVPCDVHMHHNQKGCGKGGFTILKEPVREEANATDLLKTLMYQQGAQNFFNGCLSAGVSPETFAHSMGISQEECLYLLTVDVTLENCLRISHFPGFIVTFRETGYGQLVPGYGKVSSKSKLAKGLTVSKNNRYVTASNVVLWATGDFTADMIKAFPTHHGDGDTLNERLNNLFKGPDSYHSTFHGLGTSEELYRRHRNGELRTTQYIDYDLSLEESCTWECKFMKSGEPYVDYCQRKQIQGKVNNVYSDINKFKFPYTFEA